MMRRHVLLIFFAGSSLLGYAGTACSQATTSDSAQAPVGLQEIVVTAQKREQRLEDVGITIAVADAQQLKDLGITDVTQLGRVVPGFSSTPNFAGFPIF